MAKNYAVLLPSASRTTTQTFTMELGDARGAIFILDMTVVGTGSVTLTINGYDVVSAKSWLSLAGVPVTTNVTNVYKIYQGIPVVANVSANDILPKTIQYVVTANNANPATYSLSAYFLD